MLDAQLAVRGDEGRCDSRGIPDVVHVIVVCFCMQTGTPRTDAQLAAKVQLAVETSPQAPSTGDAEARPWPLPGPPGWGCVSVFNGTDWKCAPAMWTPFFSKSLKNESHTSEHGDRRPVQKTGGRGRPRFCGHEVWIFGMFFGGGVVIVWYAVMPYPGASDTAQNGVPGRGHCHIAVATRADHKTWPKSGPVSVATGPTRRPWKRQFGIGFYSVSERGPCFCVHPSGTKCGETL